MNELAKLAAAVRVPWINSCYDDAAKDMVEIAKRIVQLTEEAEYTDIPMCKIRHMTPFPGRLYRFIADYNCFECVRILNPENK